MQLRIKFNERRGDPQLLQGKDRDMTTAPGQHADTDQRGARTARAATPEVRAQKVFAGYLADQGLKMTPQRLAILEVFLDSPGHPTSEELLGLVKSRDPAIGQATVYRTVKLLAEAGLARAVDLGGGAQRWESLVGSEHHDHLICERCKKTVEIADPRIERLQEELAAGAGFVLTGHRLYLYGLCPECAAAGPPATGEAP